MIIIGKNISLVIRMILFLEIFGYVYLSVGFLLKFYLICVIKVFCMC